MPRTIPDITRALAAVGDLLSMAGQEVRIVVVGGAALNLLGVVKRETRDVDVIASASAGEPGVLIPPNPLPPTLLTAVRTVTRDLIFLKLYAAADDLGPSSIHFQDLLALEPTDDELAAAAEWIRTQDPSPDFAGVVQQVVRHAQDAR